MRISLVADIPETLPGLAARLLAHGHQVDVDPTPAAAAPEANLLFVYASGTDLADLPQLLAASSRPYVVLCCADSGVAGQDPTSTIPADEVLHWPDGAGRLTSILGTAERFATLQSELDFLKSSLVDLNERLGGAYRTIETDLLAASALQMNLLPAPAEAIPGFQMNWMMLPSSFLTGDTLNYFPVNDRYLVFYQADVSGHGIPPAFLSVALSYIVSSDSGSPVFGPDGHRQTERTTASPVAVVENLNRRFQSKDGLYFSLLYGILDSHTGQVCFCQAGHPSPMKVTRNGKLSVLGDGGSPVGLWTPGSYDETTTNLVVGDRLVIYSDGIFDCINGEGSRYSQTMLRKLLVQNVKSTAQGLLDDLRTDLERWNGGRALQDDISVLIIDRVGRP